MACSSPHTVEQINDSVEKLIQENTIRQEKIVELAEEFSKELSAKGDMQKAYKECKDIPPEKLVATDVFLKKKKKSSKDYDIHNDLYKFASKIQGNISAKVR